MSDIQQKIQEEINKNLPAQVGDVLRKRLKEADKLEKKVDKLEEKVEEQKEDLKYFQERLDTQKELEKKEEELEVKAEELEDKRRDQEVFEAKLKMKEAEKRADQAKEFVREVFHSPVYRKRIDKPVPVDYGQGQGGTVEYHTQTEDTEVE